MSVSIATGGMFNPCCGGRGGGGGAPPVHMYEERGREPDIHIDVIKVRSKKTKKDPEIIINVGNVHSERKFD
jgi:hypothetical protein